MKRRKINTIDKEGKPLRTLKTTIINDVFAVHGTLYDTAGYAYNGDTSIDREDWTLTHLLTGGAVTTRGYTKETLIRAADMLLELGDWNFTDPAEAKKRFDPKEVNNTLKMARLA